MDMNNDERIGQMMFERQACLTTFGAGPRASISPKRNRKSLTMTLQR